MNSIRLLVTSLGCLFLLGSPLNAETLSYQGRVVVGTANFTGTGQFKFAIVNDPGTTTFWSNDETSTGGSQPTNAVNVAVANGLFSVRLGDDEAYVNMTEIPSAAFNSGPVGGRFLRIWFNDGVNGFQELTPKQHIERALYLARDIRLRGTTTIEGTLVGDGAQFAGAVTFGANLQANGGITGTQGVFSGDLSGTNADFTGDVSAATFNGQSDRNAKERFTAVNGREILDRLARLPIERWNYTRDTATPHIGPMAQDFYAAFAVGTDDRHIATVDADGVALAAIQGLHEIVREKEAALATMQKQMDAMQRQIVALQEAAGQRVEPTPANGVRTPAYSPPAPQP